MASSWCWNCLSRLRQPPQALLPPTPRISTASFHSTALRYAQPAKKKGNSLTVMKHRQSTSLRRKKKKVTATARPPAVGERKAMRKRIVLSNPNALEIEEMQDLSPETMVDSRLRGTVVGLPATMIDQLRAVQAFKPKQGWSLFRRPGTVLRRDTIEMGRLVEKISGEEKGKVVKKIITGMKGSGKTVHLLQAMTMGFLKNWAVITVPDARELVSGDTAYAAIEGTNPTQYVQPGAASALLTRTVAANTELLSSLKISQDHPAFKSLTPKSSLEDLAKLGFHDPAVSWAAFQALWKELTATAPAAGLEKDFQPRPPMLVSVDGLAHWMTDSAYRDVDYKPIHAHDLAFVNHFLSLLKEGDSLKNGGLLLYATSSSNNPNPKDFNVALDQLKARQAGIKPSSPEYPQPAAYTVTDPRVLEMFSKVQSSVELQTLTGLTRDEARGFMEYFARSGLLRESVNDTWVSEKWSLSGGGIIGELEKLGRQVRATAPVSASPAASA
ncbi:hypothetical protein PENANT_c007G03915 [Penicillium antarcticum]|uniref:Small ribosomal subunit protein mS29 n=1 Tax=Penicillium antarcticum TaxID=416450 RepID=A0A1V6QC62_9EURO|nr:uncharacterized protein N7508_003564 [Penicillium antarcticum]KAJ5312734.1 hypothetical protein N7508_003564 [Penicillium antarcticum]OQD86799.1 hypothetical protein PENANT_c007G03915 [Penicillium antarcticum]